MAALLKEDYGAFSMNNHYFHYIPADYKKKKPRRGVPAGH
jgi:hypothetical protein